MSKVIFKGICSVDIDDESGFYHQLSKELAKVAESFGVELWLDEVVE